MMSKYLFSTSKLLAILLAIFIGFVSCEDDESDNPTPPPTVEPPETSISPFSLVAQVGEEEYMTLTDDLLTGKISIIGQGIETQSFGSAIAAGGHIYMTNFGEGTIDQIQVTEEGYEKVNSLSAASLSPAGFFRIVQKVSETELLLMNWPDDSASVPYAVIELPSFTVSTSGSFTVPRIGGYDPVEIGGIVKDDKIYLGTMFSKLGTWDVFPDSLITLVYDYPSFTNPDTLVSRASLGTVAGFTGVSAIVDEQGDIYQQNIRSKHWYNMGTREEMPSVVVRIRDGAYDDSYSFNISDQFPGTVSLIGFQYVGNGIAYGKLLDEDATDEWGDAWANNFTSIVRLDLYNQTATKLDIPAGPFIAIDEGVVVDDKFYVPISPVGSTAHIYEITTSGSGLEFTVGAELDGNNVVANKIMKNE